MAAPTPSANVRYPLGESRNRSTPILCPAGRPHRAWEPHCRRHRARQYAQTTAPTAAMTHSTTCPPTASSTATNTPSRVLRLAGPFALSVPSPGIGKSEARLRLAFLILGPAGSARGRLLLDPFPRRFTQLIDRVHRMEPPSTRLLDRAK
jgi:hypothetical protein